MNKKIWIYITVASVGFIFLVAICYSWFLKQQPRILTGTARSHFPYTDYTRSELEKMYPQTMYEDVTTTQSPEQTHAKFIAALKKGDFDEAVKCCFLEEDWEKMRELFYLVERAGDLETMIGDLGEIDQDLFLDTMATYSYNATVNKNGDKGGSFIEFVKDKNGVWRIKSL